MIDVQNAVKVVNSYLEGHGFKPRDADGNDFQYGDDRDLRFKTGTSRGEVAIQVVKTGQTTMVIRVLNDNQINDAKYQIDKIIAEHVKVNSQ